MKGSTLIAKSAEEKYVSGLEGAMMYPLDSAPPETDEPDKFSALTGALKCHNGLCTLTLQSTSHTCAILEVMDGSDPTWRTSGCQGAA